MHYSKVIFAFGVTAVLIGLTGCSGKIRYPSYYTLNLPVSPPADDRPTPVLGPVAVREFSAPRFLREGPIVYRPAPEQLDFYNYDRWAEDPRRAVTEALVREVRARGFFESVDVFDGRGTPECLITGILDHLEEVDRGSNVSIEVSVSARLVDLRTGEVLWRGTSTKTTTLDQRSVPGIVSEMSRGVASAVASLVSSMQDRVSATSLSLTRSNSQQ
jgi:uncharacterized lipoprotein YmbA